MIAARPTDLSAEVPGGTGDASAAERVEESGIVHPDVGRGHGNWAAGHDDEGITDQVLGRSLVVGTAAGIPLTWAVATALMLPFGFGVAAGAAIFIGVASGPFFGAAAVLMAKVLREERRSRESAAWT